MIKRLVFLVVVLAAAQAEAQFKATSFTLSGGEDPISIGITAIAEFENSRGCWIESAFQHEQFWLNIGRKSKSDRNEFIVAGTIGMHQGAIYLSPYIFAERVLGKIGSKKIKVSGLFWPAFFFWEPRKWRLDGIRNPESMAKGIFGTAALALGDVKVTYAVLNFLDEPTTHMVGAGYAYHLNDELKVMGSMTWSSVRKTDWKDQFMPYLGVKWEQKKK
jgi:hypothetical protein